MAELFLEDLRKSLHENLLVTTQESIRALSETRNHVHSLALGVRGTSVGLSSVAVIGILLLFFRPTMPAGFGLVMVSAVGSIAPMGTLMDAKDLYVKTVATVRHNLKAVLRDTIAMSADVILVAKEERSAEESVFSVNTLIAGLVCAQLLWDDEIDSKERKRLLDYMSSEESNEGQSASVSAAAVSGVAVSAVGSATIQSMFLTKEALQAARAGAIQNAIQAFKATRTFGAVGNTAARANAVREGVQAFQAGKMAASAVSTTLM
eukprot:Platyproteum_vivax@DN7340_c0_g1_i1.p1